LAGAAGAVLATLAVPAVFEELVVLAGFVVLFVFFLVLFGLAVLLAVLVVCPGVAAGAGAGVCAANDIVANARAMANSVFFIFFSPLRASSPAYNLILRQVRKIHDSLGRLLETPHPGW